MDFAAFDLPATDTNEVRWQELLANPSLRFGLYELPAGSVDAQSPHDEDEVYYVLRGRAQFFTPTETVEAHPGKVLFVAKGVEHRFEQITEDLALLVFFAR
jgi:mannose-6-phosphate isomerase-like protein (cupin superfamily)